MSEAEDKTAALLQQVWLRNRPMVEERLGRLDRAAAAAAAGTLAEELRKEAAEIAHKFAGSLGMFGYDHGSRVARKIELLIDYPAPDAARLSALTGLTVELRKAILPDA